MLEILHKHNPFERIRSPDNCDVRLIFLVEFFTWPRNYYNDNKVLQKRDIMKLGHFLLNLPNNDNMKVVLTLTKPTY